MNDRELLEQAAKAGGIEGEYDSWCYQGFNHGIRPKGAKWMRPWNPLSDDGAALRLAVKLRLRVTPGNAGVRADDGAGVFCTEDFGADPAAATRRAITRAAAAIATGFLPAAETGGADA